MASTSSKKESIDQSMYIYKLPYNERKTLCKILDLNDAWEELGGAHLGYDMNDLYQFRQAIIRNASPSDELLRKWGLQNHTVLELFIYLSRMHHYQAMTVLKPFVPAKFHELIYRGEENPFRLLERESSDDDNRGSFSGFDPIKKNLCASLNINKAGKLANPESNNDDKKILNAPVNNRDKMNLNGESSDPLQQALEGHIPLISYEDLHEATGGWDSKNLLGKGGFGTVFKGTWKCTDVAIKRLEVQPSKVADDKSKYQSQLFTELRSLNNFRHDNILPLYGFSVGGSHDCLIYQYMPNGSLEDKLLCRDKTWPLSWIDRHNISIGIARGLQFLHTFRDKPLIHGDIKSANILLDPSLVPKIGDFGLAREGPLENYTYIKVSRVHGTKPYLPNEFLRDRKFSTKVDVYSYGIVLFELASGLRAYDDKRKHKFLKDHIESISSDNLSILSDPKIASDDKLSFLAFIHLGKQCTAVKSKNRPEMVMVLKELEEYSSYSDDLVRRLPCIQINSVQSNLPLAPDRQVTASVQPPLPKSNSPVSLAPHLNYHFNGNPPVSPIPQGLYYFNGVDLPSAPPIIHDSPPQPSREGSTDDSLSSEYTESGVSVTQSTPQRDLTPPIITRDRSNSSGTPVFLRDRSNSGGTPIIQGDRSISGGTPIIQRDRSNSSGTPIFLRDRSNSGGPPIIQRDRSNSGGTPIIPLIEEPSLSSSSSAIPAFSQLL